jgi:sugar lactone lactonase YvrE
MVGPSPAPEVPVSRRPILVCLSALALAATPLTAASAAPKPGPDVIPLVTGSMPEGISAGPGETFYAGARSDGAVYVGNTRNGKLRTLVRGEQGEVAVGLLYDAATKRLWVAGGSSGDVAAYDARSGREVFTVALGAGHFLNDVAITPTAVYVTDSTRAELVVVDLGRDGTPTGTRTLALSGEYVQPTGFGLNGIRALPTGDLLVVSGGVLYVVDPATGIAEVVEQQGRALRAGDGLTLDGRTLYVVNGYGGNEVVVLELAPDFGSTTVRGVLTDSDLDRPTTAALVDGDLYVVNGRFGTIATNPDAPVQVVRLDLP